MNQFSIDWFLYLNSDFLPTQTKHLNTDPEKKST